MTWHAFHADMAEYLNVMQMKCNANEMNNSGSSPFSHFSSWIWQLTQLPQDKRNLAIDRFL